MERTPQTPIGSGYSAKTTAREVIGGPYVALHVRRGSSEEIAAGLFWLGNLFILAVAAIRFTLRRLRARHAHRVRAFPFVAQCLPLPRVDEQAQGTVGMLPSYCVQLFRENSAAS